MESGIYQLTFGDGSRYVGKSINIPRRWEEHKNKFIKGTAAKNMQDRYNRYGFPDGKVLFECHGDHIDLMETYYICLVQPELNSTPGVRIYEHELPIFEENADLLQLPTSAHLRMINELKATIDNERGTVERVREDSKEQISKLTSYLNTEVLKTKLGKDIQEAEAFIEEQVNDLEEADAKIEELEEIVEKLEYQLSIPWWKKLFIA